MERANNFVQYSSWMGIALTASGLAVRTKRPVIKAITCMYLQIYRQQQFDLS